MEQFEVKYLLIDPLERRVWIAAGCVHVREALHRIVLRK